MVKPKLFLCVLFFLSACLFYQNQSSADLESVTLMVADSIITAENLRDYVGFLADSNITAGRGIGQIGYENTRDFLVGELRERGYEVTIQRFPVERRPFPGAEIIDTLYSWNVIGFLQGENTDSSVIMFSAHADHVGIRNGTIFPGADDNASGVAAVLGIAKSFILLKERGMIFRRSIVVCFFGAEEIQRMEGSYYFTRSDYMRRLRPVTLLNFDMVGRGGRDTLAAMGAKHNGVFSRESPTLFRLVEEMNTEHLVIVNINPTAPDSVVNKFTSSFWRSDSWNFYLRDTPVLFFFTGLHTDYHRPSDTAEKLDYEKLARIARLGFRIGLCLAMNNIWPVINRDSVYVDLR